MEDSHHSLDIAISGMSCASCVNAVESALRKIPEVKSASVNLATEKAHVELLEGVSFQTQDIIKAVNAGVMPECNNNPEEGCKQCNLIK